MTSKGYAKCYMKFDWFGEIIGSIKLSHNVMIKVNFAPKPVYFKEMCHVCAISGLSALAGNGLKLRLRFRLYIYLS